MALTDIKKKIVSIHEQLLADAQKESDTDIEQKREELVRLKEEFRIQQEQGLIKRQDALTVHLTTQLALQKNIISEQIKNETLQIFIDQAIDYFLHLSDDEKFSIWKKQFKKFLDTKSITKKDDIVIVARKKYSSFFDSLAKKNSLTYTIATDEALDDGFRIETVQWSVDFFWDTLIRDLYSTHEIDILTLLFDDEEQRSE
ncbi:hypothetical protein ACFL56_02225 [Candidatus Margulisiibacteriota bacterium]